MATLSSAPPTRCSRRGALLATSGSGVLHDFSNDCTKEDPLTAWAFVGMVKRWIELGRCWWGGIATRDAVAIWFDP